MKPVNLEEAVIRKKKQLDHDIRYHKSDFDKKYYEKRGFTSIFGILVVWKVITKTS